MRFRIRTNKIGWLVEGKRALQLQWRTRRRVAELDYPRLRRQSLWHVILRRRRKYLLLAQQLRLDISPRETVKRLEILLDPRVYGQRRRRQPLTQRLSRDGRRRECLWFGAGIFAKQRCGVRVHSFFDRME